MAESKLIPVKGEPRVIRPANGHQFTLEELHEFVGGYFQLVCTLRDGRVMICNEEGKLMGLPRNEQATMLFQTCFPTSDYIVGDAALIAREHMD